MQNPACMLDHELYYYQCVGCIHAESHSVLAIDVTTNLM